MHAQHRPERRRRPASQYDVLTPRQVGELKPRAVLSEAQGATA
jgi:hypothetical protein